MSISKDDLEHVLNLAHLEIPEDEKAEYLPQLTKVIDNMDVLEKANICKLYDVNNDILSFKSIYEMKSYIENVLSENCKLNSIVFSSNPYTITESDEL